MVSVITAIERVRFRHHRFLFAARKRLAIVERRLAARTRNGISHCSVVLSSLSPTSLVIKMFCLWLRGAYAQRTICITIKRITCWWRFYYLVRLQLLMIGIVNCYVNDEIGFGLENGKRILRWMWSANAKPERAIERLAVERWNCARSRIVSLFYVRSTTMSSRARP